MKIYNFEGELTDISAKKEALVSTLLVRTPGRPSLCKLFFGAQFSMSL